MYTLRIVPEFISMHEYIAPDQSKHALILHYLLILPAKPDFRLGGDEADSKMIWYTRDELAQLIPDPMFIQKAFGV